MARRTAVRRAAPFKDVAVILGRSEDNEGFHMLRRRGVDAEVEIGRVMPLKEGKPIDGEVVSLRARKDVPFIYDVRTVLADTRADDGPRPTSDGPPQVSTEAYRKGWEAMWGRAEPRRLPAGKPN